MALQGFFLTSLNYILIYLAEGTVTSGLVAVIFSTIIISNVILGALLLATRVRPRVLIGPIVAMLGLPFISWPELFGFQFSGGKALGLVLATVGAASASLGSILSARNQGAGLPVVQINAYGMMYGAGSLLFVALVRAAPLQTELSLSYLGSLAGTLGILR